MAIILSRTSAAPSGVNARSADGSDEGGSDREFIKSWMMISCTCSGSSSNGTAESESPAVNSAPVSLVGSSSSASIVVGVG